MSPQPVPAPQPLPAPSTEIQAWRSRVLSAILKSLFGLSTIVVVIAIAANLDNPAAPVIIPIYLACYIGLGGLAFGEKLPYTLRAGALLAVLYSLAVLGLSQSGLSGDGRIFLLALATTSALLFGRAVGFTIVGLSVATLAIFGWAFATGSMSVPIAIQANTADGSAWLTGGAVFVMLSAILVASATYLLQQLARALSDNAAVVVELEQTRASLEVQVAQRTEALSDALARAERQALETRALVDELAHEREVIRELSVPIIPVSNEAMVMPLIGALDGGRLQQARDYALRRVEQSGARHLVIDVTGASVIDSEVAQGLIEVVEACRLLGARATLVGVRPEVAQTIVSLGLDLSRIRSRADLQSALAESA